MGNKKQVELDIKFYISLAQVCAFFDILKEQWKDDENATEIFEPFYEHLNVILKYLMVEKDG